MLRVRENLVSLRDSLMGEELPVGRVQDAVIEFLRGRSDAVVFGAQAVNIFVQPQRFTEDVDVAAIDGRGLAEELREFLNRRFYIAARVREVRGGIGFRVYQVRKPENRHLVDVRPVSELPPWQEVEGVRFVTPAELIANKVASVAARGQKEKGLTDARDLMALLRTFPNLKTESGPVRDRLLANGADERLIDFWRTWVERDLPTQDDDDEFDW